METDFNSDLIQTITNRRRKPQAWNPCAVPSCGAGLPLTGPRRTGPHAETRSRRGRTHRWASGSEGHVIPEALRMDPATPPPAVGLHFISLVPFHAAGGGGVLWGPDPGGGGGGAGMGGDLGGWRPALRQHRSPGCLTHQNLFA